MHNTPSYWRGRVCVCCVLYVCACVQAKGVCACAYVCNLLKKVLARAAQCPRHLVKKEHSIINHQSNQQSTRTPSIQSVFVRSWLLMRSLRVGSGMALGGTHMEATETRPSRAHARPICTWSRKATSLPRLRTFWMSIEVPILHTSTAWLKSIEDGAHDWAFQQSGLQQFNIFIKLP